MVPPPIPDIDLRRKPLLARKATWAAIGVALLVGGAFWAGSRGFQRQTSVPVRGTTVTLPPWAPKAETLDLAIQVEPVGCGGFCRGRGSGSGHGAVSQEV